MLNRAQEFFEIFSAQRPTMFLLAKHNRVIEIENDSSIRPLKQTKLEFIKANRLEKHNHVMTRRFFENTQSLAQARTPRGQNRRFHSQLGVIVDTVAEAQAGARRVPMLDHTKDSHSANLYRFWASHSSG